MSGFLRDRVMVPDAGVVDRFGEIAGVRTHFLRESGAPGDSGGGEARPSGHFAGVKAPFGDNSDESANLTGHVDLKDRNLLACVDLDLTADFFPNKPGWVGHPNRPRFLPFVEIPTMSTENAAASDVGKQAGEPRTWLGIPIPIWVAIVAGLSGIIGNNFGHERGKSAAPDKQINLNMVSGQIRHPANGDAVGNSLGEIECSGTVEGVSPGLHLWLAVEKNGYIWPKSDNFGPEVAGEWRKTIIERGEMKEPFTLTLFAANDEANRSIIDWLRVGAETGDYGHLEWIRGINRLDRIDHLRLNPR